MSTTLLTTQDVVRIVQAHGLPDLLRRLAGAIEADFRRWPDFDKMARVANHSPGGVIELMPVASASHYSFKYVNGHPGNHRLGLPTVMAFGVLADVATGQPRLLSELTLTTAMRTAATSVMAARLLARPTARTMALVGNGAQSEFQALAFHHLLGIRALRLFDTDPSATAKLVRNLRAVDGLQITVCSSIAHAVRGADIVTTVTADKRNATIVTPDMVEPGMHLNAVGGDCPGKTELHPGVLEQASVFVEYEPQSRVEGDVQQMPAGFAVTELWRVLTGQAPGRRSADEVTVFDSVGFALEDFSALRLLHALASELGLGRPIELIPALADPKDLFSQLAGARAAAARGLTAAPPISRRFAADGPPQIGGACGASLGFMAVGCCEQVCGVTRVVLQEAMRIAAHGGCFCQSRGAALALGASLAAALEPPQQLQKQRRRKTRGARHRDMDRALDVDGAHGRQSLCFDEASRKIRVFTNYAQVNIQHVSYS